MRVFQLCVLACLVSSPVLGQEASTSAPPTSIGLSIATIYSDGQSLQMLRSVPDPTQKAADQTKMIEQTYTIAVPYTENGVSKTRTETRTRIVPVNAPKLVQKMVPLGEAEFLINLKGEQVDQATLVQSIAREGKPVLRFPKAPSKQELQLIVQLVREDAVILVSPPARPF